MTLIGGTVSFIDRTQAAPSCMGKMEYEIGGRVALFATGLLYLIESVAHTALETFWTLIVIASFGSCGFWQMTYQQLSRMKASALSMHCFKSLSSPNTPQNRVTP